jgi:hypothetical protein
MVPIPLDHPVALLAGHPLPSAMPCTVGQSAIDNIQFGHGWPRPGIALWGHTPQSMCVWAMWLSISNLGMGLLVLHPAQCGLAFLI